MVRQVGFQETDVVGMVRCVTKYSAIVMDPQMLRYELEKAYHFATTGRPGPTLIDVPGAGPRRLPLAGQWRPEICESYRSSQFDSPCGA
mgnify:CR=1 FL=1